MKALLEGYHLDYRGDENIPSVICNDWKEFSSLVESFNQNNKYDLVFRGQRRSDWKLTPSLGRFSDKGVVEENIANAQIHLFRQSIRGRVSDHSLLMDDDGAQIDELWSIGQHYGLYTPLLDWTHSPYVALYFAFEKEDVENEPDNTYRVIYVLNKTLVEKFDFNVLRFIEPRKDDHGRLVSQAGLFTISAFGQAIENALLECLREELANVPTGKDIDVVAQYIFKILVKNENQKRYIKYLRQMNIHPASLFPDLIGAANNCNGLLTELYKPSLESQVIAIPQIEIPATDITTAVPTPKVDIEPITMQKWSLKDRADLLADLQTYGEADRDYSSLVDEFLLKVDPYLKQVDWNIREPIIAQIRNVYRVVLRKNEYPETGRDAIVDSFLIRQGGTE